MLRLIQDIIVHLAGGWSYLYFVLLDDRDEKKDVSSLRAPFRAHAAPLSTPPFPKRADGGGLRFASALKLVAKL